MSHTYLLNGTTTPSISAGLVTAIQVSQDAAWIVFHNVSVNQDILLSLGVVNPGPTSTPGGEWPYVCPAGHSIKVPVPGTSKTQTAVATYWQGKIWILPINQSSQQAVTGQQPPIGNLWIMTFGAGETPAEVSPNATGITQLGQQRAVSVPISSDALTSTLTGVTAGTDFTLALFTLPAPLIAAKQAVLYLYYFQAQVDVQAALAGIHMKLFADVTTSGAVILASAPMAEGLAYATTTGQLSPYVLAPVYPINSGSVTWVSGTGAFIQLRMHVVGVTGTVNLTTTTQAFADLTNTLINPPIGYNLGNIAALY